MKAISIQFIFIFYCIPSFAAIKPGPENVILKLECITSTDQSVNGGPYVHWSNNKFNITAYKKDGIFFLRQQRENYAPTWWGENLFITPLSGPGKNSAGMDNETIWGKWSSENMDSTIEINRLNGSIRGVVDSKESSNFQKASYISNGTCQKVENLF